MKRIILTILLTALSLVCLRKLYMSRSIEMCFDAKVSTPTEVSLYIASNSADFGRLCAHATITKKGDYESVKLIALVNKVYSLKLDFGKNLGKIAIRNVKVHGHKTKQLDGFSNFEALSKENKPLARDEWSFFSEGKNNCLMYQPSKTIRAKYALDMKVFLGLGIALFLFWFMVVRYLADLNAVNRLSSIDIAFLAGFFILLFIPMLHTNESGISARENRTLAKYVPLFNQNKLNNNYGKDFEAWFNDRFLGRDELIGLYDASRDIVSGQTSSTHGYVGDDGWLFTKEFNSVDMYRKRNLFSHEELQTIGANMEAFVARAKNMGVKQVYFLLNNDKDSVYAEFYPKHVMRSEGVSRLEQMVKYLHENHPGLNVLNYFDEFQDLKQNGVLLFSKAGSHKVPMGAYYEYYYLMSRVREDFPDIKIFGLSDFNQAESYECDKDILCSMNLKGYANENFKNTSLALKSVLRSKATKRHQFGAKMMTVHENISNKQGMSAVVLSDSFFGAYKTWFLEGFRAVVHLFYGSGVDFVLTADDVAEFKLIQPDVLIVESTERFLQRFLTLSFPRE